MATVAVLGFRRRRHGVASLLRSSGVPLGPIYGRLRRWRRGCSGGDPADPTAGLNGGGGRLGTGRQRRSGFEQRGDVTPRAGGDRRRRRCAEVAAAVQRQRRSARVVACASRGGARRCARERGQAVRVRARRGVRADGHGVARGRWPRRGTA